MRKHYLRWWYTANWPVTEYRRMIETFNGVRAGEMTEGLREAMVLAGRGKE
jgi:hypothetical protein